MNKQNKNTAKAVETKAPAEVENPTPAAEQAEVGQQSEVEPTETPAPAKGRKQPKKTEAPDFLKGYTKAYPKEKVFHVTTDKQVFLGKDYSLAKAHQNSLGKGEITTYNL